MPDQNPSAVAEDAAPAAPEAQPAPEEAAPESPPEAAPESESVPQPGEETLAQIRADPALLDALLRGAKPETLDEVPLLKDRDGRARQSARRKALNEQVIWGGERQAQEGRQRQLRDAEDNVRRSLEGMERGDGEVKVPTLRQQIDQLREIGGRVKDDSARSALYEAFSRRPEVEDFTPEIQDELERANDGPLDRWAGSWLDAFFAVAEKAARERLRPEVESQIRLELVATGQIQAAQQRPGAPPTTPAGGPAGLTFEQLEHLFATGEATPEQTNAYIQERHRRGIVT